MPAGQGPPYGQYLTFGGVENLTPGVGGVQMRTLPTRFTELLMGMRSPSATGASLSPGKVGQSSSRPPAGIGDNAGNYTFVPGGGGMDTGDDLGGNPLMVWVGFALLLVAFHFVRRSQESLQANLLGVNLFNLLVITITAVLGITLFKVVFAKVPVPGVTQLLHAV